MKKILALLLILALCLFAAHAWAAVSFTFDGQYTITGLQNSSDDPDSDTTVDDVVSLTISSYITRIAENAFNNCPNLKYIRLNHSASALNHVDNGALNLSGPPALKAVYLDTEITETVSKKLTFADDSSAVPLEYVNLTDKTITVDENRITAQAGGVRIPFHNIIPDGYSGYYHVVTRTETASGEQDVFSEARDHTLFSSSNGTVTFTDNTAKQGRTYTYAVAVKEPFGSSTQTSVDVTVPPASGILLPDSCWSDDAVKESFFDAGLQTDTAFESGFRLRLSPIAQDKLSADIRKTPIPHGLLDFMPTNALAFDLTPQQLVNAQWRDYAMKADEILSASLPLDRLIPKDTTVRRFAVLHFDQTADVWDNDLGYAVIHSDLGELDASPESPLTVSGDHSLLLTLPHFSPFVILWEETDPAVLAAIETLPDTGDSASLAPWLLLLGASALLLLRRKFLRSN